MPQISLYIDEKTLKKVERAAMKQHTSISKWVAQQIREKVEPCYPADFESLFGSISDETFGAPRKLKHGSDSPRKAL